MAADATYGPKIHILQGGDTMEVATGGVVDVYGSLDLESGSNLNVRSGGDIEVLSGGDINVASGGKITIASGGKIVTPSFQTATGAALNAHIADFATNAALTTAATTKLNLLLDALESMGVLATS